MNDARKILDENTTEKDFQATVVDLAQRTGWKLFHPYDMRRSAYGYPDLTMVHPFRGLIVFAELKTECGEVSDAQHEWLGALQAASAQIGGPGHGQWPVRDPRIYVTIWRPSDWPEIERVLTGEMR